MHKVLSYFSPAKISRGSGSPNGVRLARQIVQIGFTLSLLNVRLQNEVLVHLCGHPWEKSRSGEIYLEHWLVQLDLLGGLVENFVKL